MGLRRGSCRYHRKQTAQSGETDGEGARRSIAEMWGVPLRFLKGKLGEEIFHMGHLLMEA
jgi:hypothetical protein